MVRLIRAEPGFPRCSWGTFWGAPFASKRTWSISCSIQAKSAWPDCSCFWRTSARTRSQNRVIAKISQETLAEMIGTTRPRVSFFMNKFRKLGFIDYNGGITVNPSLLDVVLHEQPGIDQGLR